MSRLEIRPFSSPTHQLWLNPNDILFPNSIGCDTIDCPGRGNHGLSPVHVPRYTDCCCYCSDSHHAHPSDNNGCPLGYYARNAAATADGDAG